MPLGGFVLTFLFIARSANVGDFNRESRLTGVAADSVELLSVVEGRLLLRSIDTDLDLD